MADRPLVEFKGTPFKEAIDFFQSKARVPTAHYTDLMGAAHSKAFMVAGAMQDELLAGFQEAIGRALKDGTTLEAFRKDFDKLVAAHGWSYNGERGWRTATIYNTNVRTSLMAGKWQQAQESKRMRPYGRYTHTPKRHPRLEHQAWDGKIVPLDDPWWDFRWPPNGWGCGCSVQTVSERELARNGWEVWNPPPDTIKKVTLKTPDGFIEVETVDGVDPSFAYNPGKAASGMRLSPSKVTEAQADGSWKGWKRVNFGNHSGETWRTLNRPELLPLDAAKAKLAEKVSTPEALKPILRLTIQGEEAFFPTADGTAVLLTVSGMLHINPSRSPFVPFIPELLADPYEIWLSFEEHEATGRVELKKRYIKYIQIGSKGQGLYLVAQVVKGLLTGWTFVPASSRGVLNNQRSGKLIWSRKD